MENLDGKNHAAGVARVQRAHSIHMLKRIHAQVALNHRVDRADTLSMASRIGQVVTLLEELLATVKGGGGLRQSGKQAAAAAPFSMTHTIVRPSVRQSPFKGK